MEYIAQAIEGQSLMFNITTKHNGEDINFNVVCASSETEIPDLISHHLDYLDNPPVIVPNQSINAPDMSQTIQDQQATINALIARIVALESK
jgi:hypothetical protein